MQDWLKDVTLKSKNVSLAPLTVNHKDALLAAASDGELWNLWYTGVPSENTIEQYIERALNEKNKGLSLPFVVLNHNQQVVGSTRFCNSIPEHRRTEIGFTWYAKSSQRTSLNTECKLLLLTHAFETLDCIAVEFRTHWHNHASRNAIARLGAKQDGVLRNHWVSAEGELRDTVVFSIIQSEWLTVKKSLTFRLK